MAWVETLLTKWFIEDGAHDIEGFKALEKSFSHQHRGRLLHSHFMRPLCQSMPRAPTAAVDDSTCGLGISADPGPPTIVINGATKVNGHTNHMTPALSRSTSNENRGSSSKSHSTEGHRLQKGKENHDSEKRGQKSISKSGRKQYQTPETPTKNARKPSENHNRRSPGSPRPKEPPQAPKGNIFAYMPYLHFETYRRHLEMQEAITQAENIRPPQTKAITCDEMLIRAHLVSSSVSLHVRRTLDQSLYHSIDTRSRDNGMLQVAKCMNAMY